MDLQFSAKELRTITKALKKMFDKSPPASETEPARDCLIASTANSTVVIESASSGLFVRASMPAKVKEEGRVIINRDMLHNLKLPSGDKVSFVHRPGTNKLRVTNGLINGELQVSEDYEMFEGQRPPHIPPLDMSLPTDTLKIGVKRISFASDADEPLRMKMRVGDGKLLLSTNDHYRAAGLQANLDNDSHGTGEIEIPAHFFSHALSPMDTDEVQIGMNEWLVRIQGGGFDIMHPIMNEGDVTALDVPAHLEKLEMDPPLVEAMVETSLLHDMVSGIITFIPANSTGEAKLELAFSEKNDGTMTAAVRSNANVGKVSIPVKHLQIHNRRIIIMSPKYLLEMLNRLSSGHVLFRAWDTQIVLRGEEVGCSMIVPQISHVEA